MKIVVDVRYKSVIVDDVPVLCDNWDDMKYPPGMQTLVYNTEDNTGIIVWSDEAVPNMRINEHNYNSVVAQFLAKYRQELVAQEQKKAELMRQAGDAVAAEAVAIANKQHEEIKKLSSLHKRIARVENTLGIEVDEEREQL